MSPLLAQASVGSPFVHPSLTLALCVLAGVGTWLLLPKPGRSAALYRVGGGMAALALAALAVLVIVWSAGRFAGGATLVYFWVFSLIAIAGSARVITHPEPVYSALYFVLTVFATAGLFVLMWAEFLAAALIVIYAGAILVTYTFVIMLASEAGGQGLVSRRVGGTAPLKEHDGRARSPLLACFAGFVTLGVLLFVIFDKAPASLAKYAPATPTEAAMAAVPDVARVHGSGAIQQLGVFLFTDQLVGLQLAGLILTLAMVGAITIARKRVLLSEEAELPATPQAETAPYTPVADNPHSISVIGRPGPRAGRRDRELAEL